MLTCIFCSRPLSRATVMLSGNPVGPSCARKHNLLGTAATPNKRVERVQRVAKPKSERDPHTGDLFDELSGSTITPDGYDVR